MTGPKIIWWLLAVLATSLFGIILSEQRALDPFQNQFSRLTLPVESAVSALTEPVVDFWKGATDRGDLLRENERFQKEIERLQAEVAAQQDASQRIQELEALLQVKEGRPQDIFLFAEVIAQDTSNIRRLIAINRGTDDGLEEGMVLVSAGGSLVGAVSRVFKDFSWVTLITDTDSAVNATVQLPSGEARGIVVGNLRHGLSLEMVPPEVALAEGALVVTSGLGGNFPSGLLIGSVRSIERKPQEPSQRAILEPAAPLSRLRGVLVLTSFVPARLQSP